MNHLCPACGYPDLAEPPRRRKGGGSYEVCPSCGFHFGVTDDDAHFTYEQWRQFWCEGGMQWSSRNLPRPEHWKPRTQLAAVTRVRRMQRAR